jgi:hypothetical protein
MLQKCRENLITEDMQHIKKYQIVNISNKDQT